MKKRRHELILNYIKNNNVSRQEEIIKMLLNNGFNVTQATISRDIKELKIIKEHFGKNDIRYAVSERIDNDDNYKMIFKRSAISADSAMNIIVVKCFSGTENAACIALDSMNLSGLVGTIAGDDTIFVACKDVEATENIINTINALLKG
ncbi:MAG: arginine repressor [Clostridia bacterium]|nr:arginine repressor [Clostridia bacterium]